MKRIVQVAVPAGTELPKSESRPSSAGLKGKSAPAAFGSVSKLDGASEPWQRGRTHTAKRLSPLKAVGGSPRHRALSHSSDTSSGLETSGGSGSEDSDSEAEEAHVPQLTSRKVSFREEVRNQSRGSGESSRSHHIPSPFDAAAQIAHPESRRASEQGTAHLASPLAPQQGSLRGASMVHLPRADVMVIGGDLAYPNPSNETYEQRFFRCACSLLHLSARRVCLRLVKFYIGHVMHLASVRSSYSYSHALNGHQYRCNCVLICKISHAGL